MTRTRAKKTASPQGLRGLRKAPIEKLLKPHEVRYALLTLAGLLFVAACVALWSMWIILRARLHQP